MSCEAGAVRKRQRKALIRWVWRGRGSIFEGEGEGEISGKRMGQPVPRARVYGKKSKPDSPAQLENICFSMYGQAQYLLPPPPPFQKSLMYASDMCM
jgi:hypothetical protein